MLIFPLDILERMFYNIIQGKALQIIRRIKMTKEEKVDDIIAMLKRIKQLKNEKEQKISSALPAKANT